MGLIKDIYSLPFYETFADSAAHVIPSFNKKLFIKNIFSNGFKDMEWKERMQHTTRVLHGFLPEDFAKAAKLITQLISRLRKDGAGEDSLAYIFFADYIAAYGLEDYKNAVKAIETVTQFVSCEFAVRPFMLKYGGRMMEQMITWSLHPNHKVRRLASEGSRPRLPWAVALPALKKDPSPLFPLLENLKNDPSDWVRRSVANNLNDIAKDHPAIVIAIAARWSGFSKETDAIIKHGCRTLLKQGHAEILQHYGLASTHIILSDFSILTPKVKIGAQLEFSFSVHNQNANRHTVRLEYGIYYKKAKGMSARKVFKISEKIYEPGTQATIHRKQSFKLITTRKFYPGQHQLSIIINGEEKELKTFELKPA